MGSVDFHPLFVPGSGSHLLVLHGTGGDEHSLVDVARFIAPNSPLISVRGRSLDEGAPRFFRRIREGVFDQADLAEKTTELATFLAAAASEHDWKQPVDAFGYSNGANMAVSLLFRHPELMGDLILLRPMVPFEPAPGLDLTGHRVLISAGSNDPIVEAGEPERLRELMVARGALADLRFQETGHSINRTELEQVRAWYGAL